MAKDPSRKRGRPKTGTAMTGASRMRLMRARRKAQGYKSVSTWINAGSSALYSSHRVIDARSLAMHALIARKIARDPSLLDHAHRNLERWKARFGDDVPAWWREWREILARPWREVVATMTAFSEEAVRLRQSSPFAGLLTPQERKRVYEAFRS